MIGAGELRNRLRFERRVEQDDGLGNRVGAWVTQCTVNARIIHRTGSETVLAARLSGVQPAEITVRRSQATLQIAAEWRAVEVRTGAVYAVTSPAALRNDDRNYLTLMATIGVGA